MSIWYAILNALGLPMFEMDFMKNALLAVRAAVDHDRDGADELLL